MNRVRGLDAIRFVCALWVVIWHYGVPAPFGHSGGSSARRLFDAVLHNSFNGTMAVVVFFVISGFAIHYPFRHGEKPGWKEYFLRRYLRIGIPMLAMFVLLRLTGPWVSGRGVSPWGAEQGVLWSLYAEIIYYTAYPLLRAARWRFGWPPVLAAAALGALLLALYDPRGLYLHHYGVQFDWDLGLVAWLLGCVLAEQSDSLAAARVPRIWLWRSGVWAASAVFLVLRSQFHVGDTCMVTPFAVLVFFWLRQEIRHFRFCPPPALLERAGAWSYSLYLMHLPVLLLVRPLKPPVYGRLAFWLFEVAVALALSYLFYLTVEKPSHLLARRMKEGAGPARAVRRPAEGQPLNSGDI